MTAAVEHPTAPTEDSAPHSPFAWWHRFAATRTGARVAGLLPLLGILAAQTALAYRLQNSAFEDEALYVYAGHREWAQLLHGTPTYDSYPSYFSGLPFLYPVAAAGFDYLGGLEAVRLFSLALMLASTLLVWSVTKRLYGRAPALIGAAFFATSGPTLFLSRLATFDALAIFLLALSFWIAVRTARWNVLFIVLAAPPIVLAIGAKYASALYAPTLIAVAVLTVPYVRDGTMRHPWIRGLLRGALLAAAVAGLLVLCYVHLPADVRAGLSQTTTSRSHGGDPTSAIVRLSLVWGGWLAVLGVIGVIREALSRRRPDAAGPVTRAALAGVLVATALLATLYQTHLHTLVSLHKHVGFGLLFATPVAGLAVAVLSRLPVGAHPTIEPATTTTAPTAAERSRRLPGLALGFAIVLAWYAGHAAAPVYGWPNSTAMVATIRPLVAEGHYRYLAEENEVPRYYLRSQTEPYEWFTTYYFSYTAKNGGSLSGLPAYQAAVADHYFNLVVLDFGPTAVLDEQITAALSEPGSGYHLAAKVPASTSHGMQYYYVWTLDNA